MKYPLTIIISLFYYAITLGQVTSPQAHFGFNIGDDYHLANFTETETYFQKLAQESDRIKYNSIGLTEEGRPQPMLIISAPENLQKLDKYQQIAQRMARAELPEAEAIRLSYEGKSVVWIDGGLHSTETVGMHQLIQMAYLLASKQDQETHYILDNTIILLTHANPDGQELVTNWYMREAVPNKRSLANLPRLYQKYAGHDNNRDFFMLNLKETQNIAKQLFIEWNPQIMYNHHQTAPAGAVVAGAPYRDPFNYVFDPLVISSIESLGAAMSSRLYAEGKPGYTQRGGSVFSTWYNGGLRTTTYFHNMIGLLTEIIGGPNPFEIPLVPYRLIPNSDTHFPILPQTWHFQQSIDYSITLNYAVLSYAAKYKSELLYNIYKMGRNSIEKGSKDTWSLSPSKVAVIEKALTKIKENNSKSTKKEQGEAVDALLKDPNLRDPRAYIISANTSNPATTIKFLNALSLNGIKIEQSEQAFTLHGKDYPSGSYIVKTNQAFRPHILDMFEAQDHPNDFEYPNGPPIAPYDAAGWTLAYLMHIEFDRWFEELDVKTRILPFGEYITIPQHTLPSAPYIGLSIKENETFKTVNQLLAQNTKIYKAASGDFLIANTAKNKSLIAESGIPTYAVNKIEKGSKPIKKLRIGLWDSYGGSMPSGWIRFLLEQYNYDFNVIYPKEIDKGQLHSTYDIIILPSNASFKKSQSKIPSHIPAEYDEQWGTLNMEQSLPALEDFIQRGGQVIAIGNSSKIAEHMKLGITNHLVDQDQNPLKREQYYTPGSVLVTHVAKNTPSTLGYTDNMDFYFSNNNVYRLTDPEIQPLLWFEGDRFLKSGWSWGESYLKDGVIGFEKTIGKGKLTVFTPDITFRAQAHGTFKLLFNNLL